MTQRPPPGEEELIQLWEDDGFRAMTSGNEKEINAFLEDLHEKLTPDLKTIVRTRLEIRFAAVAPSLARAWKDNGGR